MDDVFALPTTGDHTERPGDDALLVTAAREERAIFGELYRRYLHRIYRYMRARTGSDEDAADLTQQVFLRALDALPTYRDRDLPFAAWLFRIARNAATDAHRRRKVDLGLDLLPEALQPPTGAAYDPEAAALHTEALARLHTLLARLDPHKRDLLALRFAGGLTAREIAVALGKSEAAVHKQLARILHSLKEEYNEE